MESWQLGDLDLCLAEDEVTIHTLLTETRERSAGLGLVVLSQSCLKFGIGAFLPSRKQGAEDPTVEPAAPG